jgi:hypothetical protein
MSIMYLDLHLSALAMASIEGAWYVRKNGAPDQERLGGSPIRGRLLSLIFFHSVRYVCDSGRTTTISGRRVENDR